MAGVHGVMRIRITRPSVQGVCIGIRDTDKGLSSKNATDTNLFDINHFNETFVIQEKLTKHYENVLRTIGGKIVKNLTREIFPLPLQFGNAREKINHFGSKTAPQKKSKIMARWCISIICIEVLICVFFPQRGKSLFDGAVIRTLWLPWYPAAGAA